MSFSTQQYRTGGAGKVQRPPYVFPFYSTGDGEVRRAKVQAFDFQACPSCMRRSVMYGWRFAVRRDSQPRHAGRERRGDLWEDHRRLPEGGVAKSAASTIAHARCFDRGWEIWTTSRPLRVCTWGFDRHQSYPAPREECSAREHRIAQLRRGGGGRACPPRSC